MEYSRLSDKVSLSRDSNNFDALRLLAAFLVFYSHSFALFGRVEPVFLPASDGFKPISAGAVGVTIFFVISGFLIPASWENGRKVIPYLCKRALRIYPGLAINFIIVYALIVPFFGTVSAEKYFEEVVFSVEWFFLLCKNLLFMRSMDLNVVFSGNPVPYMVNGPLWTLPYEVMMYVAVLITGVTIGFRNFFFAVPVIFFVYLFFFAPLPVTEGDLALFFSGGFVAGTCLYVFRKFVPHNRYLFLSCLFLLLALPKGEYSFLPLYLTILSYIVIYAAFIKVPYLNRAGRSGDFSFGVYIYAWPVQQVFAAGFADGGFFWAYVFVSLAVTLMLAFFSWHIIEEPSLALKKRFFPIDSD